MLRPENESDLNCDVCNKSTKNSVLFGDFYLKKTKASHVKAHYFCLVSFQFFFEFRYPTKKKYLNNSV